MVNSQQVKETVEALKIDLHTEKIPNAIPTVETNPKIVKNIYCTNKIAINATSESIKVCSATNDTYIVGAFISVNKDVTSTSIYEDIVATIDGVTTSILKIASISLTPEIQSAYAYFSHPIKVDRGGTIAVRMSTNVANCTVCGMIYYFVDEVS